MSWLILFIFIFTFVTICSKVWSNSKKRKSMLLHVRSLAEYLQRVKRNPFLTDNVMAVQTACFLNHLRNSGCVKSEEANLVEKNDTIVVAYEMRLGIPDNALDALSVGIMEYDDEKRFEGCLDVLNALTQQKASVFQEFLGKKFICEFFGSFAPVFSYSDCDMKEYAFSRTVQIPDENDPVFSECCGRAIAELEQEKAARSFADGFRDHKDVCILSACALLTATVAMLLIHFSDSFFIHGIPHLKRYIELMGLPTGLEIQPVAVLTGLMGVLVAGISVGLVVVCVSAALRPDDDLSSIAKMALKKYLPIIASFMICISSYISIPLCSGRMFWSKLWGEDITRWAEMIFECTSPLLIWFCVIWGLLYILADILEIKWFSFLATVVCVVIGVFALCLLVFQNICQQYYLVTHISTIVAFATVFGIWSMI